MGTSWWMLDLVSLDRVILISLRAEFGIVLIM